MRKRILSFIFGCAISLLMIGPIYAGDSYADEFEIIEEDNGECPEIITDIYDSDEGDCEETDVIDEGLPEYETVTEVVSDEKAEIDDEKVLDEKMNSEFSDEKNVDSVMEFDKSGVLSGTRLKYSISNGVMTISGSGSSKWGYFSPSLSDDERAEIDKLVIKEGITDINSYLFRDFSSIEKVVIPYGVTTINEYAFRDCTNLDTVILPKTLKKVATNAFAGCTYLTGLGGVGDKANVQTPVLCSDMYKAFPYIEEIRIPKGVRSIPESCFSNLDHLRKLVFNNDVRTIGKYALSNCENLKDFKLPSSLTKIGPYAFYGCESINNVVIPSSCSTISEFAFCYCTSLKKVEMKKRSQNYWTTEFLLLYIA